MANRWLVAARWLVLAIFLALIAVTVVGIARFPAYLPGHLGSDSFSPNSS